MSRETKPPGSSHLHLESRCRKRWTLSLLYHLGHHKVHTGTFSLSRMMVFVYLLGYVLLLHGVMYSLGIKTAHVHFSNLHVQSHGIEISHTVNITLGILCKSVNFGMIYAHFVVYRIYYCTAWEYKCIFCNQVTKGHVLLLWIYSLEYILQYHIGGDYYFFGKLTPPPASLRVYGFIFWGCGGGGGVVKGGQLHPLTCPPGPRQITIGFACCSSEYMKA